jgi:hypothetical protein
MDRRPRPTAQLANEVDSELARSLSRPFAAANAEHARRATGAYWAIVPVHFCFGVVFLLPAFLLIG